MLSSQRPQCTLLAETLVIIPVVTAMGGGGEDDEDGDKLDDDDLTDDPLHVVAEVLGRVPAVALVRVRVCHLLLFSGALVARLLRSSARMQLMNCEQPLLPNC